jgi:MFS family permease
MRRALIDLAPLRRHPVFRRLWIGTSLSVLGGQLTVFAVLYQVWELTHSPLWTGAIGLAHAIPMITLSFVGGALADSVDRRTLSIATSLAQFATAVALAVQAALGATSPLLVLGLVAVQTSFAALGAPARRTFVARVLPPEMVTAGLALTQISFQGAMLLGPSVAAAIVAGGGLTVVYAVDALTFLASIHGVLGLAPIAPASDPDDTGTAVRRVLAGLRFVTRTPVLRGAFLSDLAATALAFPVALFPVVNDERFGGSPRTLGLFLSSVAVGGVIASVLSGTYTRAGRQGLVMLTAAFTWGAGLVAFGLADGLVVTMLALAVAGAADTISVVSRSSITQVTTPDAYRGRVGSVEMVVGMAGPDLGNVRAGLVASVAGPVVSLVSGGVLCMAGVAAVALRNRDLRALDLR